jgi:hypothetical protein
VRTVRAGLDVVLSRRRALAVLAASLATGLLRPHAAEPAPSAADRHLAALGARLAVHRPRLARRLHAEMRAVSVGSSAGDVRRRLLRPRRVARELARGDVVSVDGWLLARSEAATCVLLHRLARDRGPSR